MTADTIQSRATEQLMQLGLREYEAKCFVALTGLDAGTARDVSEFIDVPRTRVYEAVRALESQGLVEIQHSSPQRFRAVPVQETVSILTRRYESRIDRLKGSLREVQSDRMSQPSPPEQEVWSVRDGETITARTESLLGESTEEVFLLIGAEHILDDELAGALTDLVERSVRVVVGTPTESFAEQVQSAVPGAEVFASDLGWFDGADDDQFGVGRLLLVDGTKLLATTLDREASPVTETGIYGTGFDNCLVLIIRRLLLNGDGLGH